MGEMGIVQNRVWAEWELGGMGNGRKWDGRNGNWAKSEWAKWEMGEDGMAEIGTGD